MNPNSNLVIIKGENKTLRVKYIRNEYNKSYVTFSNGKQFPYNRNNVLWLRNPIELDLSDSQIYHEDKKIQVPVKLLKFNDWYSLIYSDTYMEAYHKSMIKVTQYKLSERTGLDIWSYYKELSKNISLVLEDGRALLESKYEKIKSIDPNTLLASYLSSNNEDFSKVYKEVVIYPFGSNLTQMQAVEKALNNRVSVIEGPPGTGKTQTILNIISNLIINGNTVAVVSNNNSATSNIKEKLKKYEYDFFLAFLGKKENKERFIKNQNQSYPMFLEEFKDRNVKKSSVLKEIKSIRELFELENDLALRKQELSELKIEKKYFDEYIELSYRSFTEISLNNLSAKKLIKLRLEIESRYSNNEYVLSFFYKLKMYLLFGLRIRQLLKLDVNVILDCINREFYCAKIKELNNEISRIENILSSSDLEGNKIRLSSLSNDVLRGYLAGKYYKKKKRIYTEKELYTKSSDFLSDYPVILSTTHSINTCLSPTIVYDYVIVDEASQVDLITGNLALSCAKNIVIVGDTKQLPNVISRDQESISKRILSSYNVPDFHQYHKYSLIESISLRYPNVSKTLLREHYRCHPKIIQFCNKKFYNNQLIIMTHDNEEEDVIKVFKTVKGSHSRGRYNQRQIDEMIENVLPDLMPFDKNELGIISPYRDQKSKLNELDEVNGIEIDTVHKYQGREKKDIVITTVDNTISSFVDNPNLLNVAISRARTRLRLIITCNEKNKKTNIGDFINYVDYNNFEIREGTVYSVFDKLYKEYEKQRKEYINKSKLISHFDSEKIIDVLLNEILNDNEFSKYDFRAHVSLKHLIKHKDGLSNRERKFVEHPNSHVDFIVFHRFDYHPILVVEVDGYKYHKKGTKQFRRDRLKDSILKKSDIYMLRLPTNGSGEEKKIRQMLLSIK